MDAAWYEDDLRQVGKAIRAHYTKIGHGGTRVVVQIDSAGGHGMTRGVAVFEKLAAMMEEFNIQLEQQPGNTPFYDVKTSPSGKPPNLKSRR